MASTPRETLLDFFADLSRIDGDYLVYDNGYRTSSFTYAEVLRAAQGFARKLRTIGIAKGDKVLFWSENRPEWVMAFWGCLLAGAIVVPVDYRASPDFLHRVKEIVAARLILLGDEVHWTPDGGVPSWKLSEMDSSRGKGEAVHPSAPIPGIPLSKDDVAEIIFTSGATSEPKGVIITHRNILANIVPIEHEVPKYRKYGRPFFPLRFLNLLPLSHLFGQAMAMFVPPMIPGIVVFMRGYNPVEIIRQVHSRRISVIVCVPKILDVLRGQIIRLHPSTAALPAQKPHILRRWWKHRVVHRTLGWKFWCFVVGAAPLDSGLEEYWSHLGYLVIQGYGLTETAPIVSLNHPLDAKGGSVGRVMPGVEVKIADDGEILVRGENVSRGYFRADQETQNAYEEGWLHTGDVGGFDEQHRLYVRGRKKEMIVTSEGLNVFPEDVERVLNSIAGVLDSAVVGLRAGSEERVHAVLVLDRHGPQRMPRVHPVEILRQANAQLADHQKIRGVTLWPDEELPRTDGTRKLKRRLIKSMVEKEAPPTATLSAEDPFLAILGRFAGTHPLEPATTLDELGLSSLERVELLLALEDEFHTTIEESEFAAAKDVAALRDLLVIPKFHAGERIELSETLGSEITRFPTWSRNGLSRLWRRIFVPGLVLPLTRLFAWIRVEGRDRLASLDGPVIFAANHQSHFDVPAIFAALPRRWRYRIAPTMWKEYFQAYFNPAQFSWGQHWTKALQYNLAVLFFNAFPLPQRQAGVRESLRYMGELAGAGYSILIFPEGARTEHGEINRFLPGVAMIATRLDLPVVPVRLVGLDRVLHHSWNMARPGRAKVLFGEPLKLQGENYTDLAKQVESAVRALG
ncbi:MAG: AMP-binding protein [Acidobacteriia bacterium]|nr:AMP-binding protein [Terriglobia bacterium]